MLQMCLFCGESHDSDECWVIHIFPFLPINWFASKYISLFTGLQYMLSFAAGHSGFISVNTVYCVNFILSSTYELKFCGHFLFNLYLNAKSYSICLWLLDWWVISKIQIAIFFMNNLPGPFCWVWKTVSDLFF